MKPYNESEHILSIEKDNRKKKCQIIIYGEKDIMIELIKNITHRSARDILTIQEIKNIRSVTLLPLAWFT